MGRSGPDGRSASALPGCSWIWPGSDHCAPCRRHHTYPGVPIQVGAGDARLAGDDHFGRRDETGVAPGVALGVAPGDSGVAGEPGGSVT